MDNPVTKNKLSVAAKGRVVGQETRDKHSDSMIKQWTDEEARKKRIESLKKAFSEPDEIERKSKASISSWADPDARNKKIEAIKKSLESPEARKRKSEASKLAWARRKAMAEIKVINKD